MPGDVVSQKQARLFGLIASGKIARKAKGLTKAEAKKALRGVDIKKLPKFARSPVAQALLNALRGMTPVPLGREIGPPGDKEITFPSFHTDAAKFPAVARMPLGTRVALLMEGKVTSLHEREGEPRNVSFDLLQGVLIPTSHES